MEKTFRKIGQNAVINLTYIESIAKNVGTNNDNPHIKYFSISNETYHEFFKTIEERDKIYNELISQLCK